ncbi:MAG TPA: SPOR domain-containing protein [Terracidiphilus sp.]|nr:SPOR domain-containing protein [Terracidiphilus sp.]
MIRDFSKDELEAAEKGQDAELTIGGGMFFALCCGLLVLCTVCFSIGYFVGHRSSSESAAVSSPSRDSKPLPAPTGSGSKPGAAGQPPARPQAIARADSSTDTSGSVRPPIATQTAVVAGNPGTPQAQVRPAIDSQVHPALVGQTNGSQPASVLQVQPAMTQVQGWMVQIAAVSHPEDAEVLVNALRKRGYAATARREVGDNLIHVQTGPFANRNDANATRQKLLNDGYNAIVE